tara:strand:+ start:1254 stop:1433 length:180 start_codon:yes stop_codon:yes gene_type:complete
MTEKIFGLKEALKQGLMTQKEALAKIKTWKKDKKLYSPTIEKWVRNFTPLTSKKDKKND